MTTVTPADKWFDGDAYERYVGRWSRQVASRFLDWLDLPPDRRWLDVGCGTGALSEAILLHCAPADVTGVEPAPGFLAVARERLGDRATLLAGDATALPLPDRTVDAVVSALVLNFIADGRSAIREMTRVTETGGTVAAYVWDYAEGMEMMRRFWDAAVALDPLAAASDEGRRFPLCRPDALARLFREAGLDDVQTAAIDIPTTFADFDDFWQPFLGGQGPAPGHVAALAEADRERLRERLRASLPMQADGSLTLTARAWAVRGRVR